MSLIRAFMHTHTHMTLRGWLGHKTSRIYIQHCAQHHFLLCCCWWISLLSVPVLVTAGDRPSLRWSPVQAVPHRREPGHQLDRTQGQESTRTQRRPSSGQTSPRGTGSGPFYETTRLWPKVSSASLGLFITELLGLLPSQPWSDVMCALLWEMCRSLVTSCRLLSVLCGDCAPPSVERKRERACQPFGCGEGEKWEEKVKIDQFTNEKMLGWVNTKW